MYNVLLSNNCYIQNTQFVSKPTKKILNRDQHFCELLTRMEVTELGHFCRWIFYFHRCFFNAVPVTALWQYFSRFFQFQPVCPHFMFFWIPTRKVKWGGWREQYECAKKQESNDCSGHLVIFAGEIAAGRKILSDSTGGSSFTFSCLISSSIFALFRKPGEQYSSEESLGVF